MPDYTVIKIKAVDQRLTFEKQPLLASGDVGTVRVEYETDSVWSTYALIGTFYTRRHPENVYEQPLTSGACEIPWEVLQEEGVLYIGLRGVDGSGRVKTAASIRCRVDRGSPSGGGTTAPPKPSASIDLTRFDAEGVIVETFANGTTKTTTMEFDENGNPVKITDNLGNETVLIW
jgi:YD repeat-containing protein